jgi:UDP-N-acetylglucosamine 2-epimerase (non-hydrolysing)
MIGITVIGTRPEAIKMAPIIKELEQHPHSILSRICVTAQHRQMLDRVGTV